MIISSTFIVISTIVLSSNKSQEYFVKLRKNRNIQNYIVNQNNILISVIEIPKINLKVDIGTNLNEGLIYVNSKLIAGHSGNCKVCYFDNLDNLDINDEIILYKPNKIVYKVKNIKIVNKDKVSINGTLNLITCFKKNKSKRLLIECIEKE